MTAALQRSLVLGLATAFVACADPTALGSAVDANTDAGPDVEPMGSSSGSADPTPSESSDGDDEPTTTTTGGPPPAGGGSGDGDTGGDDRPPRPPPSGPGVADAPPFGAPFEDVTASTGFDAPHEKPLGQWGMGIAWRDYDNDGDEDIFVTGGVLPSRLFENHGDGTFVEAATETLLPLTDTTATTWADIDSDGSPELLVLGRHRGWLLHNDDGVLSDATAGSGLDLESRTFGQVAAWADINADGNLDVFIARSTYVGSDLFFGNGDGTFTEVSQALTDLPALYPLAATFLDIDTDGDLDLYVVHDRYDGNVLLRNDGEGCDGWCFTDIAAELAVDTQVEGMGIALGDYDGDEDLDIAFSDSLQPHLLRNDGDIFTNVSIDVGMVAPRNGWGMVFLDFDADGRLDLYAGTQGHGPPINSLYRGKFDHTFDEIRSGSGAEGMGESMAIARGDLDGDGAPDLAIGNENEEYRVFRNRCADDGRQWLVIEVHGGGPVPRDAAGTRVVVEGASGKRTLRHLEFGSSFGSSNSPRMFFPTSFDNPSSVEVTWPDGTVSHPWPPPDDGVWHVEYPAAD